LKRIYIFLLIILFAAMLFAENRSLMVLKSLAVPGLSQINSGKEYGYVMLTTEALIIGSLFYFNSESDILKQESYEYAIKYAHLAPGHYSDTYFKHLARYESSGFDAGGYNNWIRQTALELYPYDPAMQQQYMAENCYTDDQYWYWDSSENRNQYNKIRNRSNDYRDYAMVTGGILLLNHLTSAIDVMRWSAEAKRGNISFSLKERTPILQLNYQW